MAAGRKAGYLTIGALPIAVAVACGGVAGAAPQAQPGAAGNAQPGATAPTQPGTTVVPGTATQPGATVTPQQDAAGIAPATDFGQSRPVPQRTYVNPIDPGRLHAPAPVLPVAPIAPRPNTVRLGLFETPTPTWLPVGLRDQVNGMSAGAEAQLSTVFRAIGVAPSRSDHMAAAT
ncbi:MAG: hypothetical protein HOQ24_15165, partial [Mycobacteriaceae bacterium]|nr:hypothetical protein [Mycobacteriaceae bacterium]